MWMILMVLVVGMVAGWVASLVVRGDRRPSDWGLLLAVGIGGSVLGGIVVNLVRGDGLKLGLSGVIGSVAGAILLLALITALGGGGGGRKRSAAAAATSGGASGGAARTRKSRPSSGGHRRNKRR